jgi:RNA polymerase sigma factor for flagellar operon FliA
MLDEDECTGFVAESLDPLADLLDGDLYAQVRNAVASLPERERAIVNMHYGQSLTMREIAARLGVSEARVCQLHNRAVGTLRAALQTDPLARVTQV